MGSNLVLEAIVDQKFSEASIIGDAERLESMNAPYGVMGHALSAGCSLCAWLRDKSDKVAAQRAADEYAYTSVHYPADSPLRTISIQWIKVLARSGITPSK
jgi:hypothetical protein